METAIRHGDRFEEGQNLYGMGLAFQNLRQWDRMRDALDRGLEIGRALENANLQSGCHNWLGHLDWLDGDYEASECHHHEAHRIAVQGRQEMRASIAAILLARDRISLGHIQEGVELVREGLQRLHEIDCLIAFDWGLGILAEAMEQLGHLKRAAILLGAAESLRFRARTSRQEPYDALVARLEHKLGEAEFRILTEEGAQLTCEEALALTLENPDPACPQLNAP
jgi:hypothetical protein